MQPTQLETSRLILRPWSDEDAPSLYKYASNPEVGPIAGWDPHTSVEYSREIIRTVFSAPETYATVLKSTGEAVGCVGIIPVDTMYGGPMEGGDVEVGYWIGEPYWGQGLIPEAVHCLLHRCFKDLHIRTVWSCHYEGNVKSRRVMEKCGFVFDHMEPDRVSPLGDVRTEYFMKISSTDFMSIFSKQNS